MHSAQWEVGKSWWALFAVWACSLCVNPGWDAGSPWQVWCWGWLASQLGKLGHQLSCSITPRWLPAFCLRIVLHPADKPYLCLPVLSWDAVPWFSEKCCLKERPSRSLLNTFPPNWLSSWKSIITKHIITFIVSNIQLLLYHLEKLICAYKLKELAVWQKPSRRNYI